MSIRDDEEFRRLLDGTKIYYGMFATNGTHFIDEHIASRMPNN